MSISKRNYFNGQKVCATRLSLIPNMRTTQEETFFWHKSTFTQVLQSRNSCFLPTQIGFMDHLSLLGKFWSVSPSTPWCLTRIFLHYYCHPTELFAGTFLYAFRNYGFPFHWTCCGSQRYQTCAEITWLCRACIQDAHLGRLLTCNLRPTHN